MYFTITVFHVHFLHQRTLKLFSEQLNFLYNQMLLVLTSKIHDVYKNNSSADIRQLLGTDTMRLMSVACEPVITPVWVAFECIRSLTCTRELREEVVMSMNHCVNESNAA